MSTLLARRPSKTDAEEDLLPWQSVLLKMSATTEDLSMEDILRKMSEVKQAERERKAALKPYKYVPPGGWKEPDPTLLAALPPGKPDPIEKAKKMVTIAKYREMAKPRTWDSAQVPAPALVKTLWRQTESDGSGHRIFNLSREAYPKDIPAQWKPGSFDQDLPDPSLELTTTSFRGMLTRHVVAAPLKVEKEVKALPARSTTERNFKARMNGELHVLKSMQTTVTKELQEVEEREAAAIEEKKQPGFFSTAQSLKTKTMKAKKKAGTVKAGATAQ